MTYIDMVFFKIDVRKPGAAMGYPILRHTHGENIRMYMDLGVVEVCVQEVYCISSYKES